MIGSSELIIILVLALLLFGPKKLPELARSVGKAVGEYQKAAHEVEEEIRRAEKEVKTQTVIVDELLEVHRIARNLGIEIEGKSKDQLLKEISAATEKKAVETVVKK